MSLRQPESQHGQQQTGDIGKVVSGIGQQPHRAVIKPYGKLDDDEGHIERNAQDKGLVERRNRMVVVVMFVRHDCESVMVSLISESSTSLLTMA